MKSLLIVLLTLNTISFSPPELEILRQSQIILESSEKASRAPEDTLRSLEIVYDVTNIIIRNHWSDIQGPTRVYLMFLDDEVKQLKKFLSLQVDDECHKEILKVSTSQLEELLRDLLSLVRREE